MLVSQLKGQPAIRLSGRLDSDHQDHYPEGPRYQWALESILGLP